MTNNSPIRHVIDGYPLTLLNITTDEFENVSAVAVVVDDSCTGPVVELGPWSMSPAEAHHLGTALRELAAVLDSRFA